MTLMEHNFAPLVTTMAVQGVQVRWTTLRRGACCSFAKASAILVVKTLDEHRVMIEMWVEDRDRRHVVQERTLLKAQSIIDHGLFHVDAGDILRFTMKLPQDDCEARLLYAQCSWLEHAGFTAGTFDRPTGDFTRAPAIAASA